KERDRASQWSEVMRATRSSFAVRAALLALGVLASIGVRADDPPAPPLPAAVVTPNAGAYSWEYGPYQYDPSGNVAVIGSDYFVYDPMGRLVKSTTPAPDHSGSARRRMSRMCTATGRRWVVRDRS